ncbi:AAA family ATPase [Leptospira sp. 2 VSF19]|uniref:AAA family ATPase n=1 Tax=Leptospira soteropolitanensis TaxID=2950025 RepID=A0AAW5VH62_9LEPT|nr:AAA family ATPase [Leptospira soteropolitanensis]MCW7491962.1 AAA family ATPase [Leptospira soteropolitanensis]MCW7499545.1 AAA family ATPase [Leptospira soteropolitanensis]MCW7520864.1 AAA family ATPase [Leptospira soteropolitanensis]MCW7525649.1 AAA family ATPase [Leptospira soteropolitanensis]MCW7529515.1 AAA family ATPase [Leptospira soteropolitanensis]
MITKFKSIKNFAVFQNYDWDTAVCDGAGTVQLFKEINVIYGRNYSGKTTLSRVIRALEKGTISNKYENPEFEVGIKDLEDATQVNLTSHGKKIRVFNEDFVKDNLRFIVNPDESINPFAILGGNADIEAEIEAFKLILGKDDEGIESGLYLELKNAKEIAENSKQAYESANSVLNQQLSNKATNNPNGIKYKSDRFGDQNYNISKLKDEIAIVTESSFTPLTDTQVAEKDTLLKENVNQDVRELPKHNIDISTISSKAEALITKPISSSDKIEQLVKDSILNRWVNEGKQHHKGKLAKCSFCGSDITDERWKVLDSHFDEESEKLEKEINVLLDDIQQQIVALANCLKLNKVLFYSKFHKDIDRLIALRQYVIDSIKLELEKISEQLANRKNDLLNTKIFMPVKDNSKRLDWIWQIFENVRTQANTYSTLLGDEQTEAKRLLRLREVCDFANLIQYSTEALRIDALKKIADTKAHEKADIDSKIQKQIKAIEDKERLMKDEEKGALKVNEYLNNFFGHDFLTLKALEESDQFGGKKIRFEIIRNGKKAHHLSEGECSLIAFCYFMAKLEDIETKGSKPIIWIDDPISSLDSNHIFFIYSLINSEIVAKQEFEQLFISTHNLDFLKYLKRLPNSGKTQFFIVIREAQKSHFKLMPKYLKDYVTEFNFLFHQIYLCANANISDEANYSTYYNFGNNARKFLEALLFYKYPSRIDNDTRNANSKRLLKYFGNNNQATVLTDRVNNELSHLEEIFDRGMIPVDIPELKKVAQFILDKIKENDNDQYDALLESIGEVTN